MLSACGKPTVSRRKQKEEDQPTHGNSSRPFEARRPFPRVLHCVPETSYTITPNLRSVVLNEEHLLCIKNDRRLSLTELYPDFDRLARKRPNTSQYSIV